MTVGTWQTQDFQTQSGTVYKTALDNNVIVGKRIVDAFAPHAKATPDMSVVVDAGYIFVNQTLTEKAQQTISSIPAPSANPRIDRIVIDYNSGDVSRLAGTEAASPVAPAIPEGKLPCCQVALVVSQTSITNANITDERLGGGRIGPEVLDKDTSDTTVANTTTETTIYSKSIGAGALGTNNTLRLTIQITDLSFFSSGSDAVTIRAKFGGTTFATAVFTNTSSGSKTGLLGKIEVMLNGENATNAQLGHVLFINSISSTDVDLSSTAVGTGTAAVDSTAAQNLVVTAQWNSANAQNTITKSHAILEVLR